MHPKLTSVPADEVKVGQSVHIRGETALVEWAGTVQHSRFGEVIRIKLAGGAVLHFAPYARVTVVNTEEKE